MSRKKKTKEIPKEKNVINKKSIVELVIISIIFKIFVILFTELTITKFMDMYDIKLYSTYVQNILSGMIPYVNFAIEYPQGFLIAILPLCISNSAYIFTMVVWDTITVVCIYLISLKLSNQKKAFYSGIIYATGVATAYFTLTKYDAFPVMLMMVALTLYAYNKELSSYATLSIGAITKWFPGMLLPLFIITDIKNKTINVKNIFIVIIIAAISCIPFFILSPYGFLRTYTFHIGRTQISSSFPYYIDFITRSTIFSSVSMYLISFALLVIVAIYWLRIKPTLKNVIIFSFLSIFSFVMFNTIFSPQYYMWFAPFIAIFLVSDYFESVVAYITQIIMYIEFPVLYGVIYINDYYYEPVGFSLMFFTAKFAFLLYAAYLIITKIDNTTKI